MIDHTLLFNISKFHATFTIYRKTFVRVFPHQTIIFITLYLYYTLVWIDFCPITTNMLIDITMNTRNYFVTLLMFSSNCGYKILLTPFLCHSPLQTVVAHDVVSRVSKKSMFSELSALCNL
jgi:hypothetical protein